MWKPIDTAPKDGTLILARNGVDVFVSAHKPDYVDGSGFGMINSCCGYYEDMSPTEWMEIPI